MQFLGKNIYFLWFPFNHKNLPKII